MSKRVYHHFKNLEEYHAGLWKIVRGDARKKNMTDAAELMRDIGSFEEAMMRSLTEWPNSTEHNLTADGVNHIAWLGHAGCCIATGSNEEATRCAWHTLTLPEQDEANAAASRVLQHWLKSKSVVYLPLFGREGNA